MRINGYRHAKPLLMLCWLFFSGASARVDLQIDSIRLKPERPAAGKPVSVYAVVRNSGSEPVRNFYVSASILRNGKMLRTVEAVPVLSELPRSASGLSLPVELGVFEEGDYEVSMTVDSQDQIDETNEDNNARSISFRVGAFRAADGAAGYGY